MLEKIKDVIYKVAIYIRLSKEDLDRGYDDSESVKNQKKLLVEYVENLGWQYELVDIYIDQGYTGTNFNRPAFKRMINDINNGKVNMVVTKDLSRLGRDYIETGEYMEKWFPENKVRYISVTDGIDTFAINNGNNDIAPFKAILNDMYSKDLSKKIKTALHTMQKEGKYVGATIPLGYKRNPKEKNKLIIDEEEAKIVRLIFDMAMKGKKLSEIRDYLNDNNYPTFFQIRRNKESAWEKRAVKKILTNPVYTGTTVQNKVSRISYKNRKLRENPKEDWIVVENTHEAIIERKVFDTVQNMSLAKKYERDKKIHYFLLDGLLVCYECKHTIGIRVRTKDNYYSLVCNNYRRNTKLHLCTSHGFSYAKLEENVIRIVRELFLSIDSKKLELRLKDYKAQENYDKSLKKLEHNINVARKNLDKMYIDKLNNEISGDMYHRLFKSINNEIKKNEEEYQELKEINEKSKKEDNIEELQKVIKDFLNLEKPTPDLMKVIINRIEIHQDKQVDIIFNFKKLNFFCNNKCLL